MNVLLIGKADFFSSRVSTEMLGASSPRGRSRRVVANVPGVGSEIEEVGVRVVARQEQWTRICHRQAQQQAPLTQKSCNNPGEDKEAARLLKIN